jgi:hypothetical protein
MVSGDKFGHKIVEDNFGHRERRTWIKFDIEPSVKKQFKVKCSQKGFDMSTYLKFKIKEFLLKE